MLWGLGQAAQAGCYVSSAGLSFGTYSIVDPFPRDTTGAIQLSCHEPVLRDLRVSIGPSANSGMVAIRKLRSLSSGDTLDYNLFIDASRGRVWGDDISGGASVLVRGVSRDTPKQVIIYGRLRPAQDVSEGEYEDQLVLTIEH